MFDVLAAASDPCHRHVVVAASDGANGGARLFCRECPHRVASRRWAATVGFHHLNGGRRPYADIRIFVLTGVNKQELIHQYSYIWHHQGCLFRRNQRFTNPCKLIE
jgi:hypothetical protein